MVIAADAYGRTWDEGLQLFLEVPGGVRLRLRDQRDADELVARARCHLAHARTRGFPADDCPLYGRGVRVDQRGRVVDFLGPDPDLLRGHARDQLPAILRRAAP